MQNRLGGAETTVHNQGSINNHLLTLAEFHSFSSVCLTFLSCQGLKMSRLSVILSRGNGASPWGFRLQGGADFRSPLVVQRVSKKVIEKRKQFVCNHWLDTS